MSASGTRHEAMRWLQTAEQDLAAATSLAETGHHAQSCFLFQQAAEKAVKAAWYFFDADPWGHSVQKLLSELPAEGSMTIDESLIRAAARLDRLYIPTRYPNGIPDLTPGETYSEADTAEATRDAMLIIGTVKQTLA